MENMSVDITHPDSDSTFNKLNFQLTFGNISSKKSILFNFQNLSDELTISSSFGKFWHNKVQYMYEPPTAVGLSDLHPAWLSKNTDPMPYDAIRRECCRVSRRQKPAFPHIRPFWDNTGTALPSSLSRSPAEPSLQRHPRHGAYQLGHVWCRFRPVKQRLQTFF